MGGRSIKKIVNLKNSTYIKVIYIINSYDFDVKDYISKFNQEHQGRINLLDFSNYSTKFNDFKENPISKKDMDIIREFQKRKIDERVHYLNKNRFECIIR